MGILKNMIKNYEYIDFYSVSLNFHCNLTRFRLGDFYMITITYVLKSNINYI